MSEPEKGKAEVSSKDPLAAFFFELARDHVPFGTLERIIQDMEDLGTIDSVYTDKNLGEYAISLARRVRALEKEG